MCTAISVVIPVYNSAENLGELYQKLKETISGLAADWEIIMVDDASKDDSYEVLKNLRLFDERLKIIRLARNYGQQQATFCGLYYAKGQFVVTLDDDLQHPPEEIPLLYNKLQEGYDAIFGISKVRRHAHYRNWGSRFVNLLFRVLLHKPAQLKLSSFRVLRRRLVESLLKNPANGHYLNAAILQKTSYIGNCFVRHDERKHGRTNYNLFKLGKMVITLIFKYSWLGKLYTLTKKGRSRCRIILEIKEIEI